MYVGLYSLKKVPCNLHFFFHTFPVGKLTMLWIQFYFPHIKDTFFTFILWNFGISFLAMRWRRRQPHFTIWYNRSLLMLVRCRHITSSVIRVGSQMLTSDDMGVWEEWERWQNDDKGWGRGRGSKWAIFWWRNMWMIS